MDAAAAGPGFVAGSAVEVEAGAELEPAVVDAVESSAALLVERRKIPS